MMEIKGLYFNNGWIPCFPGGEDAPKDDECVLALFYIHTRSSDTLTMDIVRYVVDDPASPHYWSQSYSCGIHPLCWHPLPETPNFIKNEIEDLEGKDCISFKSTD